MTKQKFEEIQAETKKKYYTSLNEAIQKMQNQEPKIEIMEFIANLAFEILETNTKFTSELLSSALEFDD